MYSIILVSIFLLCSCPQPEQRAVFIPSGETLRDGIQEKIAEIEWAGELAVEPGGPGSLLPPPLTLNSSIEAFVVPQSFPFISKRGPVYPALPGFGSLNTSALTESVTAVLNKLFTGIQAGSVPENLFNPSRRYARRIFLYELREQPTVSFWRYSSAV